MHIYRTQCKGAFYHILSLCANYGAGLNISSVAMWSLPRAGQSDFFAIDNRLPSPFNILESALGPQNSEFFF